MTTSDAERDTPSADAFGRSRTAPPALSLVVNGARHSSVAKTLAALLVELGHGPAGVATAVNGAFVAAANRVATPLNEGDEIEIVTARQGG